MNKAVEEIKEIIKRNMVLKAKTWDRNTFNSYIIDEKTLDKDLSDFLKRFEEEMIESNREAIAQQAIENYQPEDYRQDMD